MEDNVDDLDNLFEENDDPNEEPQTEGNADNENEPERVPAPKRVVKNPRLKFNPERLCGERGIPVLVNHFKNMKFKGKGHEKEDLNKLMSSLEHWCHRLFPSMKMDDCLRQIEKLGKKRPVQTCLQKIRLDQPILNSDFVHDDAEEERGEIQNGMEESEPPPQDAFDSLFGSSSHDTSQSYLSSTPVHASHSSGVTLGTSFGTSMTEEQRKRMEYNRMLAAERRKTRLLALQTNASDSFDGGEASGEPTIVSHTSNSLLDDSTIDITLKSPNAKIPESELVDSESLLNEGNQDQSASLFQSEGPEELGLDDLMDLVDDETESEATRVLISPTKKLVPESDTAEVQDSVGLQSDPSISNDFTETLGFDEQSLSKENQYMDMTEQSTIRIGLEKADKLNQMDATDVF